MQWSTGLRSLPLACTSRLKYGKYVELPWAQRTQTTWTLSLPVASRTQHHKQQQDSQRYKGGFQQSAKILSQGERELPENGMTAVSASYVPVPRYSRGVSFNTNAANLSLHGSKERLDSTVVHPYALKDERSPPALADDQASSLERRGLLLPA